MINIECQKCSICFNNNFRPIFGRGNIKSAIFFIGEAPGYSEVKYRIPFVGKSGKVLDSYINSNKLSQYSYITDAVKCRPHGNRTPTIDEIINCRTNLKVELIIGSPKIVVLLGLTAINSYFKTDLPKIGKLLNRVLYIKDRYVICTYHPSYILRDKKQELYYVNLFKILVVLKKHLNIL